MLDWNSNSLYACFDLCSHFEVLILLSKKLFSISLVFRYRPDSLLVETTEFNFELKNILKIIFSPQTEKCNKLSEIIVNISTSIAGKYNKNWYKWIWMNKLSLYLVVVLIILSLMFTFITYVFNFYFILLTLLLIIILIIMMIAIWRQPQNTSHDSFKVYKDIDLQNRIQYLFQYLDAFITTFDIY